MTAQRQSARRAPVGARRCAILAAAAELFAARGYHATGIDDLGEAVNVTGPAIYRHFESKVEILTEVVDSWMNGVMDGVDRIASEGRPPVETLDLLIDNFVTCAIEAPDAYAVVARERHHLPKDERRAIDRAHRRHVEVWVDVLCQIHPEMTADEARTIVHGIFGLAVSAAPHMSKVSSAELGVLLRAIATEVTRRGAVARRAAVSV